MRAAWGRRAAGVAVEISAPMAGTDRPPTPRMPVPPRTQPPQVLRLLVRELRGAVAEAVMVTLQAPCRRPRTVYWPKWCIREIGWSFALWRLSSA